MITPDRLLKIQSKLLAIGILIVSIFGLVFSLYAQKNDVRSIMPVISKTSDWTDTVIGSWYVRLNAPEPGPHPGIWQGPVEIGKTPGLFTCKVDTSLIRGIRVGTQEHILIIEAFSGSRTFDILVNVDSCSSVPMNNDGLRVYHKTSSNDESTESLNKTVSAKGNSEGIKRELSSAEDKLHGKNIVQTEFRPDEIKTHFNPANVIDGRKWADKEGMHVIVISREQSGEFFKPGWRVELTIAKLTMKDSCWNLDWKIRDFNSQIYEDIEYYPNTLKILDVDSDGIEETEFFYALIPDGQEDRTVKYMLHYKNVKLPIRGIVPAVSDTTGYSKKIDPIFKMKADVLLKHASETWDSFVHETFSCFQ